MLFLSLPNSYFFYLAILITGGYQNYQSEYRSVEALTGEGNQLCKLADLPDDRMYHTMDGEMLCGGIQTKKSCLQYKDGIWNVLPWQMLHERKRHVSWASGIVLYDYCNYCTQFS